MHLAGLVGLHMDNGWSLSGGPTLQGALLACMDSVVILVTIAHYCHAMLNDGFLCQHRFMTGVRKELPLFPGN